MLFVIYLKNAVPLQEPTNHLDMETIDVLIDAIKAFKGAVVRLAAGVHSAVSCRPHPRPPSRLTSHTPHATLQAVVSHDQYFLSKVAKEYWALDAGRVDVYTEFEEAKRACYTAAA
jgi:ATP-binding cassette subfamily F protein 3